MTMTIHLRPDEKVSIAKALIDTLNCECPETSEDAKRLGFAIGVAFHASMMGRIRDHVQILSDIIDAQITGDRVPILYCDDLADYADRADSTFLDAVGYGLGLRRSVDGSAFVSFDRGTATEVDLWPSRAKRQFS
ncbi:hypothetical protein ACK8OR_01815 [Jannaschia sp. KMU-145]|uniref:hypothetical protein n=1 Tax=Jannaschia halovivens TaxID=3388667 RepID=UPI00396B1539